jgi:hypothetical protein
MRREVRREGRITVNRRGLGVGVRVARNAVYSVLRRVGVFRSGTGYRRRRHREYMGLRYRLVYVGAIAVLLRFVVMRLHVNEWSQVEEGSIGSRGEEVEERKGIARGLWVRRWRRGLRTVIGNEVVAGKPVLITEGVGGAGSMAERRVRRGLRPRVEAGEWGEQTERVGGVDEIERRQERGQYRYTEGRMYVWLAGRVRRVSRMGAVVRTREEGGTKGSKGKGQRIGEQLSRESK